MLNWIIYDFIWKLCHFCFHSKINESYSQGVSHATNGLVRNIFVTFNERFVQCFAYLSSCLRDLFTSEWLTKSSNHTSLNLMNSGLVITTLGPNNLG